MDDLADDSRILVDAIARVWPDIAGRAPDGFESALLIALRELEAALDQGAVVEAQQAVMTAFGTYPEGLARVVDALAYGGRGEKSAPGIPGAVAQSRYLDVPVFFATDRAATGKTKPADRYGADRGELTYGVARVSIPDDHRMAALEKPRPWRLQFRPDPAKHVVLLGVSPRDRTAFTGEAARLVGGARVPEVLIFIHGYNVDFADAARRAAQVCYDLNFPGLPMLYSWPSEGATLRYPVDENNAAWTAPHFEQFLRLALNEVGAERVHALAHSMGNRVLTAGLVALGPADAARLGQVVFAAPDVDAQIFVQLAAKFAGHAAGRTLYASSNDLALRTSQALAKYPRAGQSGEGIVVVGGLDTIDASDLDTGLMSHSYFGDRTSVLADLYYVIRNGLRPAQRFGLRQVRHANGLPYWVFNARGA